jgi:hypothetical protein
MNTKILSENSLEIIEQYKNIKIENAVCSVPYFNNKRIGTRGGFRSEIGKGSPKDIHEEAINLLLKQKIDKKSLDNNSLKKFLVDNNIGIDCSGFAYYILNAESNSRGKGNIDRHLSFPFCKGIIKKMKCKIRPVENTSVETLAHDSNSKIVFLKDIQIGDMITMTGDENNNERDHILVVSKIEYQNFIPMTIHYVHAVAWPTDGEYGHGIHEGMIQVVNVDKGILEQKWIEKDKDGNEKTNDENYTFVRGQKSKTEVRRMRWF